MFDLSKEYDRRYGWSHKYKNDVHKNLHDIIEKAIMPTIVEKFMSIENKSKFLT